MAMMYCVVLYWPPIVLQTRQGKAWNRDSEIHCSQEDRPSLLQLEEQAAQDTR